MRYSPTSGRLPLHLAQLPALLLHRFASRSNVLVALFNVQAFGRVLFGSPPCPQPTMPSADFCIRIPSPLDAGSTRHACRSPRVLRTHLHAYACRIYVAAFRTSIGLDDNGHLTRLRRLISASCSSGQRFAFGFLQIRSRPRHPCRSANSSPCRASRGLSPPSKCALPGAP